MVVGMAVVEPAPSPPCSRRVARCRRPHRSTTPRPLRESPSPGRSAPWRRVPRGSGPGVRAPPGDWPRRGWGPAAEERMVVAQRFAPVGQCEVRLDGLRRLELLDGLLPAEAVENGHAPRRKWRCASSERAEVGKSSEPTSVNCAPAGAASNRAANRQTTDLMGTSIARQVSICAGPDDRIPDRGEAHRAGRL